MGRAQLKLAARGGEVISIRCACGYQLSSSSEAHARLARKLHGSKCALAGVSRPQILDGPAISRHTTSKAAAVEAGLAAAKQNKT